MKVNDKVRKYWRNYYKPTYRIVVFVLATVLMALSFPGIGRFSYEYELSRPWRYEDVIAPYDFPIRKFDAEITAEKDSLRKVMVPYYVMDTVDQVDLRLAVHTAVLKFKPKIRFYAPHGLSTDTLAAVLESTVAARLCEVCRTGIVEVAQDDKELALTGGDLMLIRANIVEPYNFGDLLTLREAYEKVVDMAATDVIKYYSSDGRWAYQLLGAMPLAEIIEPNIRFDENKTQQAIEDRVNNVALYTGKVMAGQLIIRTGEIVTPRTAQLLMSLKEATKVGLYTSAHDLPVVLGRLMLIGGLMFSLYLFLYYFRKDYFRQLHYINFILILMSFLVCAAGFFAQRGANISFIIPYVVLPIMLRIFTDSRMAFYVNVLTIIIISLFAYNSLLFVLLHVPAGLIACVSLFHLNKRIQIFRTAVYLFIYYCVMYHNFMFWQKAEFFVDSMVVVQFAISSVLMLLTYPLIYVIEKMFGFVSDVSLLELTDGNNELLRQLSDKAPGTFMHSMQVANLGQEIAYKIGANALLVRAGALYHDIGKTLNPMYFTENQLKGVNPHQELTFEQSAQAIIKHVTDGIKLAKKYKVPSQIRDIIATHHGTTLTRYFYISWCNEHPEEDPDMSLFTYPGPRPRTKEQAIIMMADAVEACSKSLTTYTDEAIDNLVDRIIDYQVSAKQFNKATITFAEIEESKLVLKEKLKNIYHARIKYPEEKHPEAPPTAASATQTPSAIETDGTEDKKKE